jgi:wyosine [tRNA(Phe)-imidazoG37] synthetase (radical SAM superfamily)
MYKHLFGPVPSRRLGMSLGVDLIPHKICTLNCVYCECGVTTTLTSERDEYVPVQEVYDELTSFFMEHPDPDYITFSGAGEPTLHSHIGEVIAFLKELRPAVPVAVLTNGTLLTDPGVRRELKRADLVLPSLDAATQKALKKINRPHRSLHPETYIQGLVEFGKEFKGEVWLEILVLPGYNDDPHNLSALRKAIARIHPERIQLNTLDRPGTREGLWPATHGRLKEIADYFGWKEVEIIAPPEDRNKVKCYRTDLEAVILETLSRRPCTLEDLEKILGLHPQEIGKYLGVLEKSRRIESSRQDRGTFYQLRKS